MNQKHLTSTFTFIAILMSAFGIVLAQEDPLPSWNATAPKQAIVAFVEKVTTTGQPSFVPEPERIAVFDNDGTLWPEAPMPFQVAYAIDELKRRSLNEPALASDPMVQAAIAGNLETLLAGKHHDGLMRVMALTHAGMTTDAFNAAVSQWMATAVHPRFQKRYAELTYKPMQELLRYLRTKGFKTYIVSGGGADFMRVWSEDVYGIPRENVVGSTGGVRFEFLDGTPVLIKTTDSIFVDDKEGKPVGIHRYIGRRPIACFGNSDGDQAMLEYTTIGNPRPSFGMIIHHTDAEREYAYDAKPSSSGKLTTALVEAEQRGWSVVDMQHDWKSLWSDSTTAKGARDASGGLYGKWLVEDIEARGVIDRAQSTIEFARDGSVSGNTAVNRFSGKADVDGSNLKFGPLVTTRRAGPPAVMDQEQRYIKALDKVRSFRIEANGLLSLLDVDGNPVIRLSSMD